MANIEQQLAEFEKLLNAKQIELLKKQNEIHGFVDTKHKAKATKKYQQEIRFLAKQVNDFVIQLIEAKENAQDQKAQAEKLCGAGMGLNGLAKDLGQALANDLAERRHDETVDVVKVAGVIGGLAAAAVTVSKYTFDPNSSHAVMEASVGASFGLTAAMWKPICKGFVWLGKQVCSAPKVVLKGIGISLKAIKRAGKEVYSLTGDIKNSLMLYYMKDVAKETFQRFVKLREEKKVSTLNAVNDDQPKVERGEIKKTGTDPYTPKI